MKDSHSALGQSLTLFVYTFIYITCYIVSLFLFRYIQLKTKDAKFNSSLKKWGVFNLKAQRGFCMLAQKVF